MKMKDNSDKVMRNIKSVKMSGGVCVCVSIVNIYRALVSNFP